MQQAQVQWVLTLSRPPGSGGGVNPALPPAGPALSAFQAGCEGDGGVGSEACGVGEGEAGEFCGG